MQGVRHLLANGVRVEVRIVIQQANCGALAAMGDPAFRLGDGYHSPPREIIASPPTRAMCVASCLELLPGCSQCAYMPYRGACPVLSYAQSGALFSPKPGDYRCTIYGGMLDTLFAYLQSDDPRRKDLLAAWAR